MRRILILLLALCIGGCKPAKPTLYVYSWFEYIDRKEIRAFEREHGCRVVLDSYNSNEAMLAKLRSGATGYDIAIPSLLFVNIMKEHNLLEPIDASRLSNYRQLDFDSAVFEQGSGNGYSIPYLATFSALGYRSDRIEQIDPSWRVVADPQYRGRVTLLDDMRESMGAALKVLGYSSNSRDEEQIWKGARLLRQWRDNIAKFELEQFRNGIASAEFLIVHGLSDDLIQVQLEDPYVKFLLPKEGAVLSSDHFVILKHSRNVDLAHQFIDFMCRPEVAAGNMQRVGAMSPVRAAYPLLPDALRSHPALNPPKSFIEKCEFLEDVGEAQAHYLEAWDWARNR